MPHGAGRLFQQYLVDAYAKIESQRLDWVRANQQKLRMETLSGLLDFLAPSAPLDAPPMSASPGTEPTSTPLLGKSIILPATFGGSPRALHQTYLDSMCIVSHFGKPDYLITMTANPSWTEITANLRPGETAADRPDLVARVFHSKLSHLLHMLTRDGFLGKAVAWTWVVEFQKRGLPHAHILLIVRSQDKPTTAAHIDEVVSAELPDPISQPELYRLVETHMIHGPCGHLNPHCPCMQDGVCTKNYPKQFLPETRIKEGGYPAYRRRETQPLRTAKKGVLDTRSVVPHNLGLLETFDCHLNVEVCTSIRAVKYLYKYTYKGPDRSCLERSIDEVSQYLDSRYCGAPEAAWRVFGFPLHGRSHHVERLPVHLPLRKNVLFQHGFESEAANKALARDSKLEAWFKLNASAENCSDAIAALIKSLRYPEVPKYFTWHAKTCSWKPREKISKEFLFVSKHSGGKHLGCGPALVRMFACTFALLPACVLVACIYVKLSFAGSWLHDYDTP